MSNTWIEINPNALGNNIAETREFLDKKSEIIFVVKSNAYGHGLANIAPIASKYGIKWFAVAYVHEALTLRKILPEAEIIITGVIDPSEAVTAAENNLTPIIVSEKHALSLADELKKKNGAVLKCHIKIDTGMGRLGFRLEEAPEKIPALMNIKELNVCGICSHFSSSSDSHTLYTSLQFDRFQQTLELCRGKGITFHFKHISNSGGISLNPELALDGVRSGILLYGYPDANAAEKIKTIPVLQWKTRILQIKRAVKDEFISYDRTFKVPRDTNIAVLDAGYADGYPRALSNKGIVIVGGKRRKVVGRVTMNFIMIDLGPETDVKEGDEAVLVGKQGEESIWADEIAALCDTISYEILTGIRTDDRRVIAQ